MFGDLVKMTQASAQTRDEAEGLKALDIDLSTIADLDIDGIRDGAPNTFVTGFQTMVQYITEDDALAAAICVAEKGADAIHTPGGLKTVERLAGEGLSPTSPTQHELCRFSLFSTTQVIELLNPCTPNSPQYRL